MILFRQVSVFVRNNIIKVFINNIEHITICSVFTLIPIKKAKEFYLAKKKLPNNNIKKIKKQLTPTKNKLSFYKNAKKQSVPHCKFKKESTELKKNFIKPVTLKHNALTEKHTELNCIEPMQTYFLKNINRFIIKDNMGYIQISKYINQKILMNICFLIHFYNRIRNYLSLSNNYLSLETQDYLNSTVYYYKELIYFLIHFYNRIRNYLSLSNNYLSLETQDYLNSTVYYYKELFLIYCFLTIYNNISSIIF